jgi:hypothetical protein
MEVNMARNKKEVVGNQVKKDVKSTVTQIQTTTESKKRGRQPGIILGEKQKSYVYIDNQYRLDLSDNLNKTIQKFTTRIRANDGQSEDGLTTWKAGDSYSEWTNTNNCYPSTFKGAFDTIHELMVLDGVKEKEITFVNEFMKIYKEKYDYLVKKFESMFDEEQNLRDKKKIKEE